MTATDIGVCLLVTIGGFAVTQKGTHDAAMDPSKKVQRNFIMRSDSSSGVRLLPVVRVQMVQIFLEAPLEIMLQCNHVQGSETDPLEDRERF